MDWRTDKAPKDGHPIMAEFKGPGMAIVFYGARWNTSEDPTESYVGQLQIWRNWFDPTKIYTQEPGRWLPVLADDDQLGLLRAAKGCGLEAQYRDCLHIRGYLNLASQELPEDEGKVIPLRSEDAPEEYRVVPQPDGSVECWDDYNKTVQKVTLPEGRCCRNCRFFEETQMHCYHDGYDGIAPDSSCIHWNKGKFETFTIVVTPEEKALLEAFRAYMRAPYK